MAVASAAPALSDEELRKLREEAAGMLTWGLIEE